MIDLLFLLLVFVWSAGVGGVVLRALGLEVTGRAERVGLAVPAGLGLLGLGVLLLGQVGWLNRAGFVGLFLVGGVVAWREWRRIGTWLGPRGDWRSAGWLESLCGILLAGSTLAVAMLPVTDGDALCYHLQAPKLFLEAGSFGYEPDLHETVYPLLVESIYAVGLGLRGPIVCRLLSWLLGLAFAASVMVLARPYLGRRAVWAGWIAFAVPAVTAGMSAPLNDVPLAAFGTAALVAWSRWAEGPSWRRAAAVGVFLGFALGTKYPALVWTGVLLAGMVAVRPGRLGIRGMLVAGAVALVIGGPWYLRAYLATGNPVHPFFRELFGSGLDEVLEPAWRPLAVTPWNLATALVPMTLWPERFDSVAHQFGPVFLLMLPGLVFLKPSRGLMGILGIGFAFLTLCLTQRQGTRFVLLAVGPMSVGAAWAAMRWRERGSLGGHAIVGVLALLMVYQVAISVSRARQAWPIVAGRETPAAYLERREPTAVIGRWIGEHLPDDARLIGQDHRGFYIPRPYTMELAHRRRTKLGMRWESADTIVSMLRARGFSHLVLCPPEPIDAVEFDGALAERLGPWLAAREPLFRRDLTDGDGVMRRYAIYELGQAAPVPRLIAASEARARQEARR